MGELVRKIQVKGIVQRKIGSARILKDNRVKTQLISSPVQFARRTDQTKKLLKKSGNKVTKLSHKRSSTAFGYLNKSGKRRQGPHRISHITTSVMIDARRRGGRNISSLVGTKIIPRPRVNNKILNDGLKESGAQKRTKSFRRKKTLYLKQYKRLYKKAENGNEDAAEKLIELNALQTYRWKEGKASKADMDGKGERRGGAVKDLIRFSKMKKGDRISKRAKTIDTGDMSRSERKKQSDRARQYGMAIDEDSLSDADEYGSASDSEVDMEY